MVGLVGSLAFEDNRIGDRGTTPADLRPSEYGGVPDEVRYPGPPQPNWAAQPRSRIGLALSDGLRRVRGLPPQEEIDDAKRIRAQATRSPRSDQRLAAMFADAYAKLPDVESYQAFPGTMPKALPRDSHLRWVAIGKAAIDTIHRHVDHGAEHHLNGALGRQARLASLDDVTAVQPKKRLAYELDERSRTRADEVRNYLSTGPETDAARSRQARSVHSGGLGEDALERQMAEARLGLSSPADVVRQARDFAYGGQLPADHMKGRGIAMPDDKARRLPPEARKAALSAEIVRGRSSTDRPIQADVLLKDLAREARSLQGLEFVTPRDLDQLPFKPSREATNDLLSTQGRWRADLQATLQPSENPPNLGDELAHRYMAIMLRDIQATHPHMAKALDRHADGIRASATPEQEAARGIDPYMDPDTARRLTTVSEAQRHLDVHYPADRGWNRRGADLQHVYAKELDLPAPSRASRMAAFDQAANWDQGPRAKPAPKPSRAAAMAAMSQGRAV